MGPGPQHPYTVQNQPPAGSCHYRHTGDGQPLPDSGIRPPAEITGTEKRANALSYGFTDSLHDAEYDHLLSGVVA